MDLSFDEYHTLVEQAPFLIWRCGTDAKCDYFNRRWLDFTGRSLEQELGDGWAEGVHAEDFQRCVDIFLASFAARQPFQMEYRLRRHDGQYRWISDCGTPFFGPGHSFAGYIGSCVDINERVLAQEELKKIHDAEISTLKRLLPICAGCKKIRNDQGFWEQVEDYFSRCSDTLFTHGLCPDCMRKLYPNYTSQTGEKHTKAGQQ
ncbi:PAS domain-containing protein [bacterium]|nr:PAS domain-containing protein [bacterium]